jgi:hypothetical protein
MLHQTSRLGSGEATNQVDIMKAHDFSVVRQGGLLAINLLFLMVWGFTGACLFSCNLVLASG